MSRSHKPADDDGSPEKHVVLILSADAVAAALLGALVETLGYLVQFYQPPGDPEDAMRRAKPSVAMVDCGDPSLLSTELLGRARMRGVSVVIFGSQNAMARVRDLAREFDLQELIMPVTHDALDDVIRQAIVKAC
jgi:DNA-binding NtrC family response regulator